MTYASPPAATDFAALRAVPAAIERWWLAQATEALGAAGTEETLERLRPVVRALSESFTSDRPVRYADYATDAPRRAAYGLYFGPQSWVRTRLVLAEAVRVRGWDPRGREPLRILDVVDTRRCRRRRRPAPLTMEQARHDREPHVHATMITKPDRR